MATTRRPRHSTANWARRAERDALQLHPALLAQARENSRALASPGLLLALAREIALARGPELTLAYRSVVMVQPGFKKAGDTQTLTREPCVVFVVKKKWQPDTGTATNPQHLPDWLVTFADLGGRRLPFALRTDVQPATDFASAQAHGAGSVWLQPQGVAWERGAAACAVQLHSDAGPQLCLLSAMHVLSPAVEVLAQQGQADLPARPLGPAGQRLQQPVVATTLDVGGVLRGDEDPQNPSFDVQLARIDSLAAATAIIGARRLDAARPWLPSLDALLQLPVDTEFALLVPDNNGSPLNRGPLKALLDAPMALPFALRYRVRRNGRPEWVSVYHDEALKLKITSPHAAAAGDSGCAVVVPQPGGTVTLAGLYIGGDGQHAYAIPAWQLFDMARWATFPAGARLEPVSL